MTLVSYSIEKAKYFTIMADEVTDSSNKEQVIIYVFVVLTISLCATKILLGFMLWRVLRVIKRHYGPNEFAYHQLQRPKLRRSI